MMASLEVDSLVDILLSTESDTTELHHTRTSGTPLYWRDAIGDKNKGPLTDEDIDIIAEVKKKDPSAAQEVFANLYLGNKAAAENVMYVKAKGITHIINMAAKSLRSNKFQVEPDKEELAKEGIELRSAPEWSDMKIDECFEEVGQWIEETIADGGQVLIACWQGHNRSATVVLAYLMRFKGMGLEAAITMVKEKRDIRPNNAFLQQLIEYQKKIQDK